MQGARQRKREDLDGFSSDDSMNEFSEDQVDQIDAGSSHDTSITDHKSKASQSEMHQFGFGLKQLINKPSFIMDDAMGSVRVMPGVAVRAPLRYTFGSVTCRSRWNRIEAFPAGNVFGHVGLSRSHVGMHVGHNLKKVLVKNIFICFNLF